ncbi:MAG: hypothetical protein AAGI17_05760 [Planctomycetota bacterium]
MTDDGLDSVNGSPNGGVPDDGAWLRAVESDETPAVSGGHAKRIEAMRADRRALGKLGAVSAPEGLLSAALDEALGEVDAAVLAKIERSAGGEIRRARVVPMRRRVRRIAARTLARHQRGLAVAAAAALLIASGLTIYTIAERIEPLASEKPRALALDRLEESAAVLAEKTGPAETAAAAAPMMDDALAMRSMAMEADPGSRVIESAEDVESALASDRLMIRVRFAEAVSPAMVADGAAFVVTDRVPETTLAAMDLAVPIVEAQRDDSQFALSYEAARSQPQLELAQAGPVTRDHWVATLDRTRRDVVRLVRRLEELGAEVTLMESPEAVPVEASPTPEEILWWELPPERWPDKVRVPLIVYVRAH